MRFLSSRNLQTLAIIALLIMQIYGFAHREETVYKNTSVYTQGQQGESAYQVWLNAGNQGTVSDYLQSLKGVSGTSLTTLQTIDKVIPAAPAMNGTDGKDADPCHVEQDDTGTTITCPDGSSSFIATPKDGLNAPNPGVIQFQSDVADCLFQYKYTTQRFFNSIPVPGCVPNVQ